MQKNETSYQVDFQPVGRRITVGKDASLLTAAQEAGVALAAVCGGVGACLACKVRCISGELSEIQLVEQDAFTENELTQGWRLACQVFPRSDVKIEVPPESMTTAHRLQIEGTPLDVTLAPGVFSREFQINFANGDDLRADWERFVGSVDDVSLAQWDFEPPVLSQFSGRIREWQGRGKVILDYGKHIIGFLQEDQSYFGLAVDIGTTKMAAFLVDLTSGKTVAKMGVMNPQIAYGEDVVSRIAYSNQGASFHELLHSRLIDLLNKLIADLCNLAAIEEDQIVDFVVVGNTAMHHFFAGMPVRQLGEAPYVAAVNQAIRFPARGVGLSGAPGARVYMPPNVAGYVGADHIAMLLASSMDEIRGVALALDIGTNTEISLSKEGCLHSCSCASGPAFEGAHIHAGMRAVPGAIERAQFYDDDWHVATIDGELPLGICGSGILDVVAALLGSGQIDSTGRFTDQAFRRIPHDKGGAIVLVPGAVSGTGKDILVTRDDIREIQLAKAAIRAGIAALLRATGSEPDEIDHFMVAGAFGTYLSLESAVQIGMFPKLPKDRFHQIGNAAGAGAQQMLVSHGSRLTAEEMLKRISYIELTTDPGFMESYVDSMGFD